MKYRWIWLALSLALFVSPPASAQAPALPGNGPRAYSLDRHSDEADKYPASSKIYEEIEIFRRILGKNIYHASNDYAVSRGYGAPGLQQAFVERSLNYSSVLGFNGRHQGICYNAEGFYIKGQGVVYTMTLPRSAYKAQSKSEKSAPPAMSDWERMRKQLHGEKVDADDQKKETPTPTLREIILKVLAENGHHLSLSEGESLTIAVTFRGDHGYQDVTEILQPPMPPSAPMAPGIKEIRPSVFPNQVPSVPQPESPNEDSSAAPPAPDRADPETARAVEVARRAIAEMPGVSRGASAKDDDENYEQIGDLHARRGQAEEAINAYKKALQQAADLRHASAIKLKMAAVYLASKEEAKARQLMQEANEALARPGGKPVPAQQNARKPLPIKLIISASKELLDQAGKGKMSSEEFQKGVTVQTLFDR